MATAKKGSHLKTLLSFLGPGFLVTVGFIDPGNWATNIEGGSKFGYDLLWVITLSTFMLIVIQNMAAKLGIATGKSLAVNIRERFSPPVSAFLGLTIVLACVATDVAELLGGAIGFNLLFGMPLWSGALLTVLLEVFLIVSQRYHRLEAIIMGFLGIIGLCYLIEILIVKPDWVELAPSIVIPHVNRSSIYIAMGILGAVVMPHNIFLHSNVIPPALARLRRALGCRTSLSRGTRNPMRASSHYLAGVSIRRCGITWPNTRPHSPGSLRYSALDIE